MYLQTLPDDQVAVHLQMLLHEMQQFSHFLQMHSRMTTPILLFYVALCDQPEKAIIIHAVVPVIIGSGNLQGTKLLCWLFLTPLTFGIFLR